jgi:hypothetical protein
MSLTQWKDTINEGDLVIFYENFNKMQPVVVSASPFWLPRIAPTLKRLCNVQIKSGTIFNNRFGHFAHADAIGKPYGYKLYARKGAGGGAGGFVTCLHPTAELWTSSLRHRTQVSMCVALFALWLY